MSAAARVGLLYDGALDASGICGDTTAMFLGDGVSSSWSRTTEGARRFRAPYAAVSVTTGLVRRFQLPGGCANPCPVWYRSSSPHGRASPLRRGSRRVPPAQPWLRVRALPCIRSWVISVPCSVSTRQIGSTPHRSPPTVTRSACSTMNLNNFCVAGRARPRRNPLPP